MKVLIISPCYPFPESLNGVNKINVHLLSGNPHFRADILCVGGPPPNEADIHSLSGASITIVPADAPSGRIRNLLRWLAGRYPFNVAKLSPYWDRLAAEAARMEPGYDIIHISTPSLAPVAKQLQGRALAKTVLFPVDSMALYTERRAAREPSAFARWALRFDLAKIRRFERSHYLRPAKVMFVSEADCAAVTELLPDADVSHIPNGVDIGYFMPVGGGGTLSPSLVFTGVMSYAPNRAAALFLARGVMPVLRRTVPGIRLCLAGREPDAELSATAGPDIQVTGFVEDIRKFLGDATLYLSPLPFGSGIKNKVLEAMAMGKAVLGTPLSFEGIEGEPGRDFHCLEGDAAAWAARIAELIGDPSALRAMGACARGFVERNHSWDAIQRRYREVYESRISHR